MTTAKTKLGQLRVVSLPNKQRTQPISDVGSTEESAVPTSEKQKS